METNSTRQRLMRAAESLIAQRGIAAVRTREILQAAGQRNQSALQYHFGSRPGLLRWVLLNRLTRIDCRREAILENSAPEDNEATLRAMVLPLAEEIAESEGGRDHIRFLAQLIHSPGVKLEKIFEHPTLTGLAEARRRFRLVLSHLEPAPEELRRWMIWDAAIGGLLNWSVRHSSVPPAVITEEIIALILPMLSAPSHISKSTAPARDHEPDGRDIRTAWADGA